jgi:hypothetical protein
LDKLKIGTRVDVTGYVSNCGTKKVYNNHRNNWGHEKIEEEDKVPNVVAFNITVSE